MLVGASRSTLLLAVFALISLTTPLYAAWYDSIYIWIGFSVGMAAAFIALAYMAAKLFEVQMLEAWVKIELQELATSVVIAVFCVVLIATADSAAQFLTGHTGTTVTQAAADFMRDDVYSDGRALYLKLAEVYFNIAKIAGYSYTAGVNAVFVSMSLSESPGAGLSPLLGEVGQAMDSVVNFMLLAAAQSSFLKFFASASAVLLPVGIFLRSFSLTRKVGGVVLAGAIASAVIYPSAVLISSEVYHTFQEDLQDNVSKVAVAPPTSPPVASVVCSSWMQTFVMSPIPLVGGELGWFLTVCLAVGWIPGMQFFCSTPFYKITELIFMIVKSAFPIIMYFAALKPYAKDLGNFDKINSDYFEPMEQYALPAVAKYSVLSIVVFLIPIIITVTLVRNLAITFGGEPQLYGLSKLI